MKSKQIAVSVVFATLYVVLGFAFQPLSFEAWQLRIACAIVPLLFFGGYPALLGLTVGHLIFNLTSPFLPWDLLSPLVFIPARIAIMKYGFKAVPLHVLSVAVWVSLIIQLYSGTFVWPIFIAVAISVGIGEGIVELVLGRLVYLEFERREWLSSLFQDSD